MTRLPFLAAPASPRDGVGKALPTYIAPPERRATGPCARGIPTGVGVLMVSLVAGLLWDRAGAAVPFLLGAVAALARSTVLRAPLPARPGEAGR